ncbi:MAG: LacI family DNA-binding transcriptional regulator [Enterocloster sp.]
MLFHILILKEIHRMNHTSHNVTIGDVAKAAGTSVSTVSVSLSGSTYPVSAAKRNERVLHAANTLDTSPTCLDAC